MSPTGLPKAGEAQGEPIAPKNGSEPMLGRSAVRVDETAGVFRAMMNARRRPIDGDARAYVARFSPA